MIRCSAMLEIASGELQRQIANLPYKMSKSAFHCRNDFVNPLCKFFFCPGQLDQHGNRSKKLPATRQVNLLFSLMKNRINNISVTSCRTRSNAGQAGLISK